MLSAAALAGLNAKRCLAPTQDHPRACRCDRPWTDGEDCGKCGLPIEWAPAPGWVMRELASWCASEDRRARARRTGR